jgi:hypothetical protein
MTKCMICHKREAEVPDRDKPGRPVKRVCRKCHEQRLLSDLQQILVKEDVNGRSSEHI